MFWFRQSFVKIQTEGTSRGGRPLYSVTVGQGKRRILLTACHHANEYLTGLCLWGALEDYCIRAARGELWAACALADTAVLAVPWVNPDGVSLMLGLASAEETVRAAGLNGPSGKAPFPEEWKANAAGVDLNLNYPAAWDGIRERKQVFQPGPRDYAGPAPLSEPETAALAALTRRFDPAVTVALHSQGEEIYANFGCRQPRGTRPLAGRISAALGYPVIRTPEDADAGGYKDWFIQEFDRPGFTVELGLGENPLPLASFGSLREKTVAMLRALLE